MSRRSRRAPQPSKSSPAVQRRSASINYRSVVKALLLIFVAASLASVGIQEYRQRSQKAAAAGSAAPVPVRTAPAAMNDSQTVNAANPRKVIAYYFYTTVRCPACRNIQAFTQEALKQGFPEALRDGALEWRLINVQLPHNRHFIQQYQLFTKSVVITRVLDGKQVEWKNLERVWELTGQKNNFLKYIQAEVRAYLEKV